MSYLLIFMQSALLEVPTYLWFSRASIELGGGKALGWPRRALGILTMNSITHPVVFFGFMNLPQSYLANILLAEAFAIVSETLIFYYVFRKNLIGAFLASLVSNLISWQMAPILTYLVFG